tara:strand:- start:298 stop:546 length:249 start_codon:yes stop_codon:yes gene_type:complete
MKATLEISKYPLSEDYEPKVLDFIERLNTYKNITVKTNVTSTHVTGVYDEVMPILQKEIKISYEKYGKAIFVVKVLMGDLGI